jgi:4-hydroxyphenylacetate 3-monooxygenase
MTVRKTGAEHIKSLQDGRTVFIDGKRVADVTEHPAFRNSVRWWPHSMMSRRGRKTSN